MALTVAAVSTQAAVSAALNALSSYVVDPDWICGTKVEMAVPTAADVARLQGRGEVVLVVRDGTTRVGLAVANPETGRLRWVLCRPAYYVEVVTAVCRHAAATWGVRAWAWNEGTNLRTAALRAHPLVRITEEKTTGEGVLVVRAEWVGP